MEVLEGGEMHSAGADRACSYSLISDEVWYRKGNRMIKDKTQIGIIIMNMIMLDRWQCQDSTTEISSKTAERREARHARQARLETG